MAHIKISRGLDIPIKGKPQNGIHRLRELEPLRSPHQIALDLTPFQDLKFRLLVKQGDFVKIGQPLLEDKESPGRLFVSPASGVVSEIRRGLKRVLLAIAIEVKLPEEYFEFPKVDPDRLSHSELIERLKSGGIFSKIRSRPFNILANPEKKPRCIVIKALESGPLCPPSELQVIGQEKEFQAGLTALSKLCDGPTHLIYSKESTLKAFREAKHVQKHTAEGPHPIGTHSVLIQNLCPIKGPSDNIWTLNSHDIVSIGHLLLNGRVHVDRVISIAGPAVLPDWIGYFKVRSGYPVSAIISGRVQKGLLRFISGDPLMGHKVTADDFLGFADYVFCVLPENTQREFLHFWRPGFKKYTASHAYLSGHLQREDKEYDFTTNQHGEHRPFIDSTLYDQVQPLDIPTMLLVKAVMAEDYDLADSYGLLEVDPEDFALSTFVCPSKIEMTEIIRKGLKTRLKEEI